MASFERLKRTKIEVQEGRSPLTLEAHLTACFRPGRNEFPVSVSPSTTLEPLQPIEEFLLL